MKVYIYHIIFAISLWLALLSTTSCTMSSEDLKRIVRKEAGKDDYRDSEKWGKVVTKTLSLNDFTHINLSSNADIKFRQGEEFTAEAYGNEKAIAFYDINVADGILLVNHKKDHPLNVPSIRLVITAPTLESINVSGAGDIELKDTIEFANDLTINIAGAGDVEINRLKCKNFSLHISGAGDIEAQKIKCKGKADIQISGAGDLKADIRANDINVAINGAGDADLDVKCKNINVTTSGAGEVELEGECESLTKHSSGMASIDSRNLTIHEVVKIQ